MEKELKAQTPETWVVVQSDREASRARDLLCGKEHDTSRGSPRSFAAQRTLAQDDN